jgi:hypothetical protein
VDEKRHTEEQLERLRGEVAQWRRRAEVAEAVAAERLARAETAERALQAAEAALRRDVPSSRASVASGGPVRPEPTRPSEATEPAEPERAVGPRSWLDRWRRYTDSIS